jgi:signal transduction histidine kinase
MTGPNPNSGGVFRAGVRWRTLYFIAVCSLALSSTVNPTAAAPGSPTNTNVPVTDGSVLDPNYGLGSWIWTSETHDKQTCRLWRSFEIPKLASVARAQLTITGDNEYRLFLDGREVGHGSDWRSLTEYDLTWLLFPGTHILAIEAFNDQDQAGIILGMRIELEDGQIVEIGSDKTWRVVPDDEKNWLRRINPRPEWPEATMIAPLGSLPWWSKPLRTVKSPPLRPVVLQFWQEAWFQITLMSVCVIAVLLCLRLATQLTVQSKAQRLLQIERARIARDIHDDLGAGLTQLVLLGEVAQSELPANSQIRGQIDHLCERARDLSRTMDEIVWAVNSRRDTLRDFATYVCKYAQGFLRTSSIKCRLDVEPELPPKPFDLPIRRNLFLAVKEALNNAAKHSEASELFLRIHQIGEGLLVVVEDNGIGMDRSKPRQERNGFTNMSHRMNEVAGQFRITSAPGKGCRVEFQIDRTHVPQSPRWMNRHNGSDNQDERSRSNTKSVGNSHVSGPPYSSHS